MAAAPSHATPLLGLKLGSCSCLVLASDRARPELGEEISFSASQRRGPAEDQHYAPARRPSAARCSEDRGPSQDHQNSIVVTGAAAPAPARLDASQEPAAAAPRSEQQPLGRASEKRARQAPRLGPIGCGGWHLEEHMTEDMRQVMHEAVEQVEREERRRLSQWHLDFLTPATLVNYVDPVSVNHLVITLKHRTKNEDILTCRKDLFLNQSMRVVGWDAEGCSIISTEPCTMRKSMLHAMDQVDYLVWTAMDLNKPGANGFVTVTDFGGGFNPFHVWHPQPMITLAGAIEGQWRRRLKASYMVEMPTSFERFLNFFLRCVKESTREKFHFASSKEEFLEMLKQQGCDEETVDNCRRSMENRRQSGATQTWFPMVDNSFFKEKLADLGWNQDLMYLTEKHHTRLREAIQQFRIWKWGVPEAGSEAAAPDAAAGPTGAAAAASAAREQRRGSGAGRAEPATSGQGVGPLEEGEDQGAPLSGGDGRRSGRKARPRSLFKRCMGCLVCGACGK